MQVPFRQGVVKSVPKFLQLTLGGTSLFGDVPQILILPVQIPCRRNLGV